MELSNTQIARLVLGYLKSENCESAFHEFLINSQYLKAVFEKNGKYFATRVEGFTLEDILADYSEASLFVQGRLEQTDFYEKELTKGKKPTLTTQLFYLLDHNSRSCSPTLPNNLNATPSESLPGNSLNNSLRTSVLSEEHTHPGFENISNVLTTSQKDDRKAAMADELDKQMKKIAEKKEQDPAFDQILEEFIGHKHVSYTDDSRLNQPCTTSNMDLANLNKMSTMVNPDNFSNPIKPVDSRCTKSSEMVVADPCPNKTATAAGLLMVPSVMGRQSYILGNSAPTASSTLMQNVLTENNIMKTPTVILDDRGSARQSLVSVQRHHTIEGKHIDVKKALSKAEMDRATTGGGSRGAPRGGGGGPRGGQGGGNWNRGPGGDWSGSRQQSQGGYNSGAWAHNSPWDSQAQNSWGGSNNAPASGGYNTGSSDWGQGGSFGSYQQQQGGYGGGAVRNNYHQNRSAPYGNSGYGGGGYNQGGNMGGGKNNR